MPEITLDDVKACHAQAVKDLYIAVDWSNYFRLTNDQVAQMINNSDYTTGAFIDHKLVGFVRGLSDGYSVNYIENMLVHPDYHRKGIGRKLMETAQLHYPNVRKTVLLTGMEASQEMFYTTLDYTNLNEAHPAMKCYIRLNPLNNTKS